MLITVFTTARHWSLSQSTRTQSTPSHPISLRSILILSLHLRLCLPFRFSDQKLVCISHRSHACYMLSPFHPTWLNHPDNIWPSSAPCSQTPSVLCSFLSVRDGLSHPYKARGKIILLCILMFQFWESRRQDKRLWIVPKFILLLTSSRTHFDLLLSFTNTWTSPHFQRIY
jgi:hypothetical protein